MKNILKIIAGFVFLCGCATTNLKQSLEPTATGENIVKVTMNVNLERDFVRENSSIGAGKLAICLISPLINNNVITICGTVIDKNNPDKSLSTFSKELRWGDNSFIVQAQKNSRIKLVLHTGGTRTGNAELGTVDIGEEPSKNVVINLTKTGVQIQ